MAGFGVSISVSGFDDLERRLRALPIETQEKVIKDAGRFAMRPVLEDAKSNVPVSTGLLRDSLRITSRTGRGDAYPIEIGLTVRNHISFEDPEAAAQLQAAVGRRSVKLRGRKGRARIKAIGKRIKVQSGVGWRWHFIETGAPGRGQPARPFLRPALERNKEAALQRFKERLARAIDKATKA